jgi:arylsulfatase A-like enzyme/sugar lactone lactonase YvrE
MSCSREPAPPEPQPDPAPIPHFSLGENKTLSAIDKSVGSYICSIAPDGQGNVYLINPFQEQVFQYNPWGELVQEIASPVPNWKPTAAVAGGKDSLYVASEGSLHRYRITTQDWDADFALSTEPLKNVKQLVIDATGAIWAYDPIRKEAGRYSPEGNLIGMWKPSVALVRPRGFTLSPAGEVILGDENQFLVFNHKGELLRQWDQPNRLKGSVSGAFLTSDDRGFLYATHPDLHTVEIYDLQGKFLDRWIHCIEQGTIIRDPNALAFDPRGRLYIGHKKNQLGWLEVRYRPPQLKPSELGVAPEGPNVILITLDTTRLDHLGFAGYHRETSPALDTLAEKGVWFPGAVSAAPDTVGSHCTIMTSLQPFVHEARNLGFYLRPEFETVAERFQEAGYHTGAFISGYTLRPELSWLDQGFDVYDDLFTIHDGRVRHVGGSVRTADFTNEIAFRWLKEKQGKQIFLWVHYFDPHLPYTPKEPYLNRFQYDTENLRLQEKVKVMETEAPTGEFIDRYDEEILQMDTELGRLLQELETLGFLQNAFLAVVGDHGEMLHDDNGIYFGHGRSLLEGELKIPLILRDYTGELIGQAGMNDWAAEQIDIAPTLLEAAGLAIPSFYQGQSLLAVLHEEGRPRPFTWSQLLNQTSGDPLHQYSVRKQKWKLRASTMDKHKWIVDLEIPDNPAEKKRFEGNPEQLAEQLGLSVEELEEPAAANSIHRLLLHWMFPGWDGIVELNNVPKKEIHARLSQLYGQAIGWNPDTLQIEQPIEEMPMDEQLQEQMNALGYTGN